MIEAIRMDCFVHVPQKFFSVSRHEIYARDRALLQSFAGIQQTAEHIGFPGEDFGMAEFGASGFGA
jgi:hypothetical protein